LGWAARLFLTLWAQNRVKTVKYIHLTILAILSTLALQACKESPVDLKPKNEAVNYLAYI